MDFRLIMECPLETEMTLGSVDAEPAVAIVPARIRTARIGVRPVDLCASGCGRFLVLGRFIALR